MSRGYGRPSKIQIRSITLRHRLVYVVVVVVLAAASSGWGVEIWSDEEGKKNISLDTSLKFTSLFSHAPNDPVLFPERDSSVGFFRLRLTPNIKLSDIASAELAYEHRMRMLSRNAGGGNGVLPAEADAPFRIGQLDWQIAQDDDTFLYMHEIDRALVTIHPDWGEVTLGRQAVGLGRGILFGAVDVFSPFSPMEVDREWRRGIDAFRLEYRISDTTSAEIIAACGEEWDESAVLGRIRGFFGSVDGELIFGQRGEDGMYAGTISASIFDAEAHMELAVFETPEEHPDGGLFGSDNLVGKAVLGSSYTFDVGDGLTILAEYHYSGFGVEDIDDATARLADPDFQKRILRGDTQIVGQQALAVQGSYPINDAWNASLLVLESPEDSSGLISPSLSWDCAENATFVFSGFVPWGDDPSGGQIESEYGGSSLSLFLQLSLYY